MRNAVAAPGTLAGDAGGRRPALETPSGKGTRDENFPVGSFLIERRLRAHVAAFYAFARAADDIADNPGLTPEEKLRRLDLFEAALEPGATGPEKATRLRDSLREAGIADEHPRRLLAAFRLDATKARHASWDELSEYCSLSAHPVGRYMLDLHGEDPDTYPPSDALTAALQVLNHLQDLKRDYLTLDRIYLPADWMAAEGVAEPDLAAASASPGLRRVIDCCLDGCDRWLDEAAPPWESVRSRRLAAEATVIHALARRLSRRLRREDPLAGGVRLRRTDFVLSFLSGARRLLAVR